MHHLTQLQKGFEEKREQQEREQKQNRAKEVSVLKEAMRELGREEKQFGSINFNKPAAASEAMSDQELADIEVGVVRGLLSPLLY